MFVGFGVTREAMEIGFYIVLGDGVKNENKIGFALNFLRDCLSRGRGSLHFIFATR